MKNVRKIRQLDPAVCRIETEVYFGKTNVEICLGRTEEKGEA